MFADGGDVRAAFGVDGFGGAAEWADGDVGVPGSDEFSFCLGNAVDFPANVVCWFVGLDVEIDGHGGALAFVIVSVSGDGSVGVGAADELAVFIVVVSARTSVLGAVGLDDFVLLAFFVEVGAGDSAVEEAGDLGDLGVAAFFVLAFGVLLVVERGAGVWLHHYSNTSRRHFDILKVHSQQGGLCLILGEPGTGKTILKNALTHHDPKQWITPVINRSLRRTPHQRSP